MDLDAIKKVAEKLMKNRRVHLDREVGGAYYHGERVANLALELRKIILPDDNSMDDVITVAGWFHDVGKGIEPHSQYGEVIARKALTDYCTKNELEAIAEMISLHCNRKGDNNYSDAVKIIQDADLLDHFGTFTIWMDLFYSAYNDRSMKETAFYDFQEWMGMVDHHRNRLNYDISKRIYDEKIDFINAFYERMKAESEGKVFGLEDLI